MANFAIEVVTVGSPTSKGTRPLIVVTSSGELLTGWASSSVEVTAGQVLPASCLSHDRETGKFWVYVS